MLARLFLQGSLQSLCELIRAACWTRTALDSLETLYDLFNGHAFNQGRNALRVAVAAALEGNAADDPVLDLEVYRFGAGTSCGERWHFHTSFCKRKPPAETGGFAIDAALIQATGSKPGQENVPAKRN